MNLLHVPFFLCIAALAAQALRSSRMPSLLGRKKSQSIVNTFATKQDDRPPSRILELINNTINPSTLLKNEAAIYGVLTAISEQYLQMGNPDLALNTAYDAISVARHSNEANNVYYAYAEGLLAQAYEEKKDFEQAAEHYKKALIIYEKHYSGKNDPIEIESVGYYQLISWFLLSQGRYREAISACQMALDAMESLLGQDHVDTAATMVNLAAAQINTGDLGTAPENLLNRAMNIYQNSEYNATQDEEQRENFGALSTGISILRIARLYEGNEDFATAFLLSHEAFPSVAFSMVSTLCNLGTLYFLRGDDDKAFDYYNKLYRMTLDDERDVAWPGLPKIQPDNDPNNSAFGEINSQFGLCLKNFGVLLLRKGKPFAAREVLLKAKLFLENSKDFGPGHPITNKVQSLVQEAERKAGSDAQPDDGFWMF